MTKESENIRTCFAPLMSGLISLQIDQVALVDKVLQQLSLIDTVSLDFPVIVELHREDEFVVILEATQRKLVIGLRHVPEVGIANG